ncbi:hypothetical protein [Plantactinospora sp. KBS50]|uniref:hypothetical protein n=1 Tax=Plantactinospora sp. KBS50 TaxID=2024580 RepID=UPI000BAA9E7E|nr:hypothetical protein [Plantactinospora sp. KBS50]ASW56980.1 hypothetical protein CIK06_26715 [Plantactinospora sp. KBS50]
MSGTDHIGLPRPVRLASALVATAATLAALDALAALLSLRRVNARADSLIRLMYDPEQGRQIIQALRSGLYDNLAIGIVVALLLLPLAFGVRRPSRRIRVVMWVVPVVAWTGLGCALATGPEISTYTDGIQNAAALHEWKQLVPGWYNNLHSITVFLILAGLTAAALLLTKRELVAFYGRSDPETDTGDLWSHLRRDDNSRSA